MSHTIGQIKEDNLPPKASQDSPPLEDKASESVSVLSDADYEFLFNQLLEGISHGWHNRRIVKFFNQLGDRGKQEDWIVWLERLRPKIITLPIQSKRQLGTIMIRLGELTQSAPEVSKIGGVSNRIGRELLFGNTEDVVWEYVGPDLIVDSSVMELEAEETFSERLPTDFVDLGSSTSEDPESGLSSTSTLEQNLPEHSVQADLNVTVEKSSEPITEEVTSPEISDEPTLIPANDLKLEADEADEAIAQDHHNAKAANTYSDEFEFELNSQESEPVTEDLIQSSNQIETPDLQSLPIDEDEQLLNLLESANSLSDVSETVAPTSPDLPDKDPVTIDVDQVMNLIQADEELAQQISQKLNLSLTSLDKPVEESLVSSPALNASHNLDRSSIDLIEGWFNLGLKQVSGGEFGKAIASWEKALSINPNLSEAWHNRGSALGRLGKYSQAVESFQKALAIDSHNYQAWNDRAHALYQLENWAAAADSWSNAIKITPANHLFWYNRGCALEQLESWAESIASYEKCLEIKPDFQPARSRYTNLVADNSRSN